MKITLFASLTNYRGIHETIKYGDVLATNAADSNDGALKGAVKESSIHPMQQCCFLKEISGSGVITGAV